VYEGALDIFRTEVQALRDRQANVRTPSMRCRKRLAALRVQAASLTVGPRIPVADLPPALIDAHATRNYRAGR